MKKIILLFLFLHLLIGCEKKSENHIEKITFILNNAFDLEKNGNLKETLNQYLLLNQYKDTKDYKTLKIDSLLMKRGWSSNELKDSYTLKLLTKLQNEINAYFSFNGKYPKLSELETSSIDPWERPIILKLIATPLVKGYDYSLRSLGKDGIKDTDDDIAILNKAIQIKKKLDKPKKLYEQKKVTGEKLLSIEELIAQKGEKS